MKIKSGFILQKVGASYLAVAVGERADEFNGLVRMNATGAFFWKLLTEGDLSRDELLAAAHKEYDVADDVVARDLDRFVTDLSAAGILDA